MKKDIDSDLEDDLRAEYDLSQMKGKVRGKYAHKYTAESKLVLLDPDVAAAFESADAVNEALRLLIKVAQTTSSNLK